MMAAGCSNNQGSSGATPTETGAAAGPLFSEGDIVQVTSGSSTTGYLILGYDAGTATYTRAVIHKNTNGAWGYRTSAATNTINREELERVYSVVGHVSVSAIPTSAPTPAPTTKVTTKATTAKVTTTATTAAGKPTIKSIDPEEGTAGESVEVEITGTNFKDDATCKLTISGDSVTASDVSVDDDTKMTCTFDIPSDATVGTWSVVVTNPDGKSGELTNYFIVHEAEVTNPTVTKISPTYGLQGSEVVLSITGTNFEDDAEVTLTKSGEDDIDASDVTVSSSTKISATFEIPDDAKVGSWTVVVTNPGDLTGKLSAAFSVRKND